MNKPKKTLTPAQAMNRAATLCSASELAPSDIQDKLIKWGLTPDESSCVIQELTDQGFLDEQRFARAFVHDRHAFNGWGRIKIAYQLRQKGISGDVINDAIATLDDEAYRQTLVELLRAKWRSVKGREPRAAWAAMMRFAASRGFESAVAATCVKQVTHLDAEED